MNVIAIPLTTGTYSLECDECGPLGIVDQMAVHPMAQHHLIAHGIEVPPVVNCECGYDYTRITGHDHDHATCNECAWQAYGMFADHQGHHHYLDSGHTWQIMMGDKR